MGGFYLSNINSIGKQMDNGNIHLGSDQNTVFDKIDDESIGHTDHLSVMPYTGAVDPKAAVNFSHFLVGDSIRSAVVQILQDCSDLLTDELKVRFNCNADDVKYLVAPSVAANFIVDGNSYELPLILQVISYDNDTNVVSVKVITGVLDDTDAYNLPRTLRQNELLFALSDIPDIAGIADALPACAVALAAKCPAVRKDAGKDDVFVFTQSKFDMLRLDADQKCPVPASWIKMHSLAEKAQIIMDNPELKFKVNVEGQEYNLPLCLLNGNMKEEVCFTHPSGFEAGRSNISINISPDNPFFHLLHVGSRLSVDGVNGYVGDDSKPDPRTILVLEISKIEETGNMLCIGVNGRRFSADDPASVIPSIPAGAKFSLLGDNKINFNCAALVLEDQDLVQDGILYSLKKGEFCIMIPGHVAPVEFDALLRQ